MEFKTGLYDLNENANFDFQLNRLINWDGGELDEVKSISRAIKSNSDWKEKLIMLGDRAYQDNRIENAIAYYRMSEFFMFEADPDKIKYYRKSIDLFYKHYEKYFTDGTVKKFDVAFEDMSLPVLYSASKTDKKGTILFHGGNDSYFEELFFPMLYFSEKGYDVYLFEGPGQGGVLREQGKKFTYKWEKPVKAILDYFNLKDVIIIGVSLGGMLAPRAAAFEKRIKHIVAWSVFPNFLDVALYGMPKPARLLMSFMLRHKFKPIINLIANTKMRREVFMQWVFEHGMYAYDAKTPYDYLKKLNDFQILNIAEKITQDILILHGKKDHFIGWRLYEQEINSLTNAKSITFRLFTDKEHASNHCQCGNTRLVLDTVIKWLDTVIEG